MKIDQDLKSDLVAGIEATLDIILEDEQKEMLERTIECTVGRHFPKLNLDKQKCKCKSLCAVNRICQRCGEIVVF